MKLIGNLRNYWLYWASFYVWEELSKQAIAGNEENVETLKIATGMFYVFVGCFISAVICWRQKSRIENREK